MLILYDIICILRAERFFSDAGGDLASLDLYKAFSIKIELG
jgi:hypothetical protein